jgi:hypothetical protein
LYAYIIMLHVKEVQLSQLQAIAGAIKRPAS